MTGFGHLALRWDMLHALKRHPDFHCAAVSHIDVDVARAANTIALRYIVTGNTSALRIPPRAQPVATHELWKHTCFEIFVRRCPSPNAAPSLLGKGEGLSLEKGTGGPNLAPGLDDPNPAQGHGTGYLEFNFSPSTQWAAYSFTDRRRGMASIEEIVPPTIETKTSDTTLELATMLDLGALNLSGALTIGLSAVIEESNGAMSYWALAHPKGKADFHHSDCFALTL
jgi:hypothetical protein